MDEGDSLKITFTANPDPDTLLSATFTTNFGMFPAEVAALTTKELNHIKNFLEAELRAAYYKAMEEEVDRQIYAASNHHIPEGVLRSILSPSTDELQKTNAFLTGLFNDMFDKNTLRYWGKRLFNKRRPEWLSDREISQIYDEIRKKHERRRKR